MALGEEFLRSHIEEWCETLARSHAPFRKYWPKYLFRHERIENAARIIASGRILSRRDATGVGFDDVAPEAIIAKDERSHQFVRMYFRPATPTQFHVEGVRKETELYHGKHSPVLVMLVFKKETLLALPRASFSDGNMQSEASELGDSEEFFRGIPFADVFHHGALSEVSKARIVRARCAEALLPSPISLNDHLYAVVCRSSAERSYLLTLLGDEIAPAWRKRIVVGSQSDLFCLKYAFVNSVDAAGDGVLVKFHPRADGQVCKVGIEVTGDEGLVFLGGLDASSLGGSVRANCLLVAGTYKIRIWIDETLAYDARHLVDDLPF